MTSMAVLIMVRWDYFYIQDATVKACVVVIISLVCVSSFVVEMSLIKVMIVSAGILLDNYVFFAKTAHPLPSGNGPSRVSQEETHASPRGRPYGFPSCSRDQFREFSGDKDLFESFFDGGDPFEFFDGEDLFESFFGGKDPFESFFDDPGVQDSGRSSRGGRAGPGLSGGFVFDGTCDEQLEFKNFLAHVGELHIPNEASDGSQPSVCNEWKRILLVLQSFKSKLEMARRADAKKVLEIFEETFSLGSKKPEGQKAQGMAMTNLRRLILRVHPDKNQEYQDTIWWDVIDQLTRMLNCLKTLICACQSFEEQSAGR